MIMNIKRITSLLILLAAIALGSCKTREKLVYFQEGDINDEAALSSYTPVFKIDDLLSIVISAEDPETIIPFNQPTLPALPMEI